MTNPPRSLQALGVHRVVEPAGVLPQAARRLNPDPRVLADDEVVVAVDRLNLDAASYRQLAGECAGDPARLRARVLEIVAASGKMHNPVTGSGGMLLGRVAEVGPASPLGLAVGDRVATLVSLTLTPLTLTDGLAGWDGRSEQVPAAGYAVLFGRSQAAVVPDDLPAALALAVLDVCGAPALVARHLAEHGPMPVLVVGGGGKSGSLALAAAGEAGCPRTAVVPGPAEAAAVRSAGLAEHVVVADARDPVGLLGGLAGAPGAPGGAGLTVVCVDVAGCEAGAILATRARGTVVFFSMTTDFARAALTAEGLVADVTLVIGNGYVPGHAELALALVRRHAGLRALLAARVAGG